MNHGLTILIAEDDENDVLLLQRALKKNGVENPVYVCRDGEDAINYLCGSGVYEDRSQYPFPSVIFLDIKMPKKNGFDVLAWLKDNPDCSIIPKIVLSSSKVESDIEHAYRLGANSYIVKPSTFDQLVEMIRTAYQYWCWCERPKIPQRC